jgi:UDP-N-acetylmuramoylalanine--D-glutamate ligase
MKLNKNISRIGIWGFGKMGKSAVQYLHTQGYDVSIMDARIPTPEDLDYLREKNITWYDQNNQNEQNSFFNFSDYIIPSAGIYISPSCYATHIQKWLPELDFFYQHFHKPIIAITGSIGKTSITHILSKLFQELSVPVAVGGNIGIPTFDLIAQQNNVDYAVLEVSSFQLMHCEKFAPTVAVWTNFYPNHLDYHASENEYFLAKYNIFKYQSDGAFSFVPLALREKIPAPLSPHTHAYFVSHKPSSLVCNQLQTNDILYYAHNNIIWRYAQSTHTHILSLTSELYNLSFLENIILIAGVCDIMKKNVQALQIIAATIELPAHRLEKIGSVGNVTFYNDSKSTTIASTLAAVEKLKQQPLHLFLGGLSKGVDRALFVAQLKNKVKHIYCFGKEANILLQMCTNNSIMATQHINLKNAIDTCMTKIKPGDCVLLSPAGSSFDLYNNYEHRGNHFKELVKEYFDK